MRFKIACENSRPSSLPATRRFARQMSAIYRRKFHTDDVNVNFIILNKLSFAVTKGLYQAANVLHSHKCTSLATSDVQGILEIPVPDEIHMENRNHGLD